MSRDEFDEDGDRPRRPRDSDDEFGDADNLPRRRRADDYGDFDDDYGRSPPGDGLATAAMVIGIVSCVCALGCCVPIIGYIAGPLSLIGAITAIILGFVARGQSSKSGKATAGIITGFAALLIIALVVVLGGLVFLLAANK
jgi:hypothetical protein